jgi:uncharacterized protein YbjQ (UPF0145 family)
MKVVTVFSMDGYEISDYIGLVKGLVVRSPTIAQGIFSGLKGIVGGNQARLAQMCEQARAHAQEAMEEHAKELGADAVVGVTFDASGVGGSTATEVLCYGTAVKLKKKKA